MPPRYFLLRLDPSISLIQPLEAAQLLMMGESPTRWTRPWHSPPRGDALQAYIPTAFGSWHDGEGHFLTLYICNYYWSLLDPLHDLPIPPLGMQTNLHSALRESFTARNLPVPPLPHYRQAPRVATQIYAPRPVWSIGNMSFFKSL